MIIEKRIERIKAKLILEQPYFGTIASSLKCELNENIQSFKTTPKKFEYNDDFIDTLRDEQIAYTLTNCAMHYALDYKHRQESRIQWLWKLAQDYAINSLLINNGMNAPKYINHDIRFDKISAEEIYNTLEDEIDDKQEEHDSVEHIHYEQEIVDKEVDKSIIDNNTQILNKAKKYGDLPLGIEILIPELNDSKIDWKNELYEVIEQSIKFDYRLSPPNKRFLSMGVALPSLGGSKAKIVIAIDSSGSIDNEQLRIFLSEVQGIMNQFENFEIDLITADVKVHEHIILQPGDILEQKIIGGGGTNFENTFTYIQNNIHDITLFLYFTDGIGKFPKEESTFETIWVITNDKVKVPFGRCIQLK
jgi:predicted metal-dependent peptidase